MGDGGAPQDDTPGCPPPPACAGARFQPLEDTLIKESVASIWGSTANDVWGVGNSGLLLHFDGLQWSIVQSSDRSNLLAVSGSAADDVWAVGERGMIRHFDGAAWSTVASGTSQTLYTVWSSGRNDAWAAGAGGALLRWNGATWTAQGGPASRWISGLWGSGGQIYAVGSDNTATGLVLRYSAGTFSPVYSDQSNKWYAIWGSGPNDLWIGGETTNFPPVASLLHYDGATWKTQTTGYRNRIRSITGSGPSDVWAVVGGVYARYDGTRWTYATAPSGQSLDAVFSIGTNRVLSGGLLFGAVYTATLARYDGATWLPQRLLRPVTQTLRALWGSGPGQVIAAGDDATMLSWNGQEWLPLTPINTGHTVAEIYQITGDSARWRLGVGAPGKLLSWDGGRVSPDIRGTQTTQPLYGAFVNVSDHYLVGAAGTFIDTTRSPMPLPLGIQQDLRSAWAPTPTFAEPRVKDLWISGKGGTLLRYDGTGISAQASGTTADLLRLWGSAADDLWLVGSAGTILHWDGARLTPRASGTTQTLRSVYGTSRCEVWAVGDAGTVLRYDGKKFAAVPSNTTRDLHDVWVSANACEVWVSGAQGARLRYQ